MIALLITFIAVFAIAFGASLLIVLDEVANWMDEAEIEIEERKPQSPLDLENTEYDWGHDIRNYMEE